MKKAGLIETLIKKYGTQLVRVFKIRSIIQPLTSQKEYCSVFSILASTHICQSPFFLLIVWLMHVKFGEGAFGEYWQIWQKSKFGEGRLDHTLYIKCVPFMLNDLAYIILKFTKFAKFAWCHDIILDKIYTLAKPLFEKNGICLPKFTRVMSQSSKCGAKGHMFMRGQKYYFGVPHWLSRKVECSKIVILAIHFCSVQLARICLIVYFTRT
jgi:hypothetical protein